MKLTQAILLFLFLLALWGCGLSGDAIHGKVVDEQTGQPVPNAIVVARWRGDLFAFVESQTVCVHVDTATTDEKGQYRLPAWRKRNDLGWVRDVMPVINIYKQGYSHTYQRSDNVQYLKPFTGTREERFEYLSRVGVSCSHKQQTEINLLPLYKALYEEARTLALTRDEKLMALYRLRDVERLELGSDQAWENFRQRQRELQ